MKDAGLWIGLSVVGLPLLAAYVWGAVRRARRGTPEIDLPATYAVRARLKRMARPTLLLVPARHPGFSKVGGAPDLPPGVAWPSGPGGPKAFVAQVELALVRALGEGFDWLPESGFLYLFFDEARNGWADSGRVLFAQEPGQFEAPPPHGLPGNRRFLERRVGFIRFPSMPSEDWLGEGFGPEIDLANWKFAAECDLGDEIEHRIGGFPSEIQGGRLNLECEYLFRGLTMDPGQAIPDELRRASRRWRLLFQIDSDEALKMNWWDGGRLYVFVRASDAVKGDFSKTVTISQTY